MDEKPKQHFYGGQAVVEGVMMRGLDTWAVAVRRPSREIYVEVNPVVGFRKAIWKKPIFRGVAALVDALRIGIRALTISSNQAVEEEERLTPKQTAFSMVLALIFFVGVFIVLPNVGLNFWKGRPKTSIWTNLIEGGIRLTIFLGYLIGISFMKEIRRVFMYHGAEHKTIAAHEAGEPALTPDAVDKYSTLHVRCGTNFLIIVMLLTVVIYSFFPWRGLGPRILSRIVAIPLVAGISYEFLRLGAAHGKNIFVRALMKPGLWLQMITTRPPTPDQIEVAVRAFEAVLPQPERTIIPELPSPIVNGESSVATEPKASAEPPVSAEPSVVAEPGVAPES